MTVTFLPDDACPTCGYELDACSPMSSNDREQPGPGDITLCFGCGEVLWLDAQLKHQLFPAGRLIELEEDFREFIRVGQTEIRALRARQAASTP